MLHRALTFPHYHGADQVIHYLPTESKFTPSEFSQSVVEHLQTLSRCTFVYVLMCPGLRVKWTEEDQLQGHIISVPPEVYTEGCVRDVDDGLAVSVIIKKTAVL